MVKPLRRAPIDSCSGPWDAYVEWYRLDDLDAPHEPDRAGDLETIAASMTDGGWTGRPLLATKYDDGPLTCQTGSHRLVAARTAGLREVPVVVIDCTQELDREDAARDPFEMIEEYAVTGGQDLLTTVRELWKQDGYRQ